MKRFTSLLMVATLAAVALLVLPVRSMAADPVAMVVGGGTADFQDTPDAVNTTGYTNFSVAVTVYSDASASGQFTCQIPGVVIIAGDVLDGWVNGDGSVTIEGLAHGYDHFFGARFTDLPFTVTLRAGAPGVGGFDYRDESGFFGPGQFDTELIRRGMILIAP
jgi:hypothetical protein